MADEMKSMKLPKGSSECCPPPCIKDEEDERYPELSLYGPAAEQFLQQLDRKKLNLETEIDVKVRLCVNSLSDHSVCFEIIAAGKPTITGQKTEEGD